jgi:hypothetical protein
LLAALSGRRTSSPQTQGYIKSHAHIFCGIMGKNILGLNNHEMLRGVLHVDHSTKSTRLDRTFLTADLHGLGEECAAGLRAVGLQGQVCDAKTGRCFIVTNNQGHALLGELGERMFMRPDAGEGWGGPKHPQRKLLAIAGMQWYGTTAEVALNKCSRTAAIRVR